jgi:hypothetical protein
MENQGSLQERSRETRPASDATANMMPLPPMPTSTMPTSTMPEAQTPQALASQSAPVNQAEISRPTAAANQLSNRFEAHRFQAIDQVEPPVANDEPVLSANQLFGQRRVYPTPAQDTAPTMRSRSNQPNSSSMVAGTTNNASSDAWANPPRSRNQPVAQNTNEASFEDARPSNPSSVDLLDPIEAPADFDASPRYNQGLLNFDDRTAYQIDRQSRDFAPIQWASYSTPSRPMNTPTAGTAKPIDLRSEFVPIDDPNSVQSASFDSQSSQRAFFSDDSLASQPRTSTLQPSTLQPSSMRPSTRLRAPRENPAGDRNQSIFTSETLVPRR